MKTLLALLFTLSTAVAAVQFPAGIATGLSSTLGGVLTITGTLTGNLPPGGATTGTSTSGGLTLAISGSTATLSGTPNRSGTASVLAFGINTFSWDGSSSRWATSGVYADTELSSPSILSRAAGSSAYAYWFTNSSVTTFSTNDGTSGQKTAISIPLSTAVPDFPNGLSGKLTGTATTITGTIPATQVSGLASAATTGTAITITGTIPSTQVSGTAAIATAKAQVASAYAAGMESLMSFQLISNPSTIFAASATITFDTPTTNGATSVLYSFSAAALATGSSVRSWTFGPGQTFNFATPLALSSRFTTGSNGWPTMNYGIGIGGTSVTFTSGTSYGKGLSFALINGTGCLLTIAGTNAVPVQSQAAVTVSASSIGTMVLEWDGTSIARGYVSSGTAPGRPVLVVSATAVIGGTTGASGAMLSDNITTGVSISSTNAVSQRVDFFPCKLYFPGTN